MLKLTTPAEWRHVEFARVISCTRCKQSDYPNLLRDDLENIPQPGYIGSRYRISRVLLIGQNPKSEPGHLDEEDRIYTSALRILRDNPTAENYRSLSAILRTFIPKWPVCGRYFPLEESGLTLDDIAYCNIVRCRTTEDIAPSDSLASECIEEHFDRWLTKLEPKVVVFIGKWAWNQGKAVVNSRGIPNDFVNRWRQLPNEARMANRAKVAALVKCYRGLA